MKQINEMKLNQLANSENWDRELDWCVFCDFKDRCDSCDAIDDDDTDCGSCDFGSECTKIG